MRVESPCGDCGVRTAFGHETSSRPSLSARRTLWVATLLPTRKPPSRHTKSHELEARRVGFHVVSCRALGPLSCRAASAATEGRSDAATYGGRRSRWRRRTCPCVGAPIQAARFARAEGVGLPERKARAPQGPQGAEPRGRCSAFRGRAKRNPALCTFQLLPKVRMF